MAGTNHLNIPVRVEPVARQHGIVSAAHPRGCGHRDDHRTPGESPAVSADTEEANRVRVQEEPAVPRRGRVPQCGV